MLGRVTVRLVVGTRETRLTVEDDGWGFWAAREEGEGLGLTQALAFAWIASIATLACPPLIEAWSATRTTCTAHVSPS